MKRRLVHIGVHDAANKNAGDTLLYEVTRRAFAHALGPIDWTLHQQWQLFDKALAEQFNKSNDGIVIGGGGVFLRDQDGANIDNSGWQWNSTLEAVRAIDIPVILFATGYNRFRGQEDFPEVFTPHINAVYDKAPFFSLRNSGSVRAMSKYVAPRPDRKISRQYCPTTLIWQLYPHYRKLAETADSTNNRVLAVNAAFDRPQFRFREKEEDTLLALAGALGLAEQSGWTIVNVCHKDLDRQLEPYLERSGVKFARMELTNLSPDEIMDFYARIDVAIGMRGHAQMIPFGLRRPIFSLISHNKLTYFLEDIGHPEWGAEVDDPKLEDKILSFLAKLGGDRSAIHAELAEAQEACWADTEENFKAIRKSLENE